jgi:alpha-maltose-1-phosphate synthase
MRVALSVPGKFHTFDLARELHARGSLAGVLSGYPRFKLKNESLPENLIHTFPWLVAPYMAYPFKHALPSSWLRGYQHLLSTSFAQWVSRTLPACDVFVGLSGTSMLAGQRQRQQGGRYVCDRGSAHIRTQEALLREEHSHWGLPFEQFDSRVLETEEAEYELADCITVPSEFARQTFVDRGLDSSKVQVLPYGVNLKRFQPTRTPDPDRFDVLFVGAMSLRKGIPYLLQAFRKLRHKNKSLLLAGAPSPLLMVHLKSMGIWPDDVTVLGHVPQADLRDLMSKSHVLVLPSVEDGFGMVLAQAMACGCPVIASNHTGGSDLISDGTEGFLVPMRSPEALADRMQQLADDPELRSQMGFSALERVKHLGGWDSYGTKALGLYRSLVNA